MDVHVKFDMASKYQAKELFKRFYPEPEFGPFNDAVATVSSALSAYHSLASACHIVEDSQSWK
jgi:hypothetical protein